MPMAATNQMVAAVVTPCMLVLPLSNTPPPRKPTPVTIWAATRPESPLELVKAYPTMVNAAEPSAIKAIVRIPAGFSLRCRSIPTQAPHSSARMLSEMDPQGYGNNECQLSMSHCISYGNENANGMQREELQDFIGLRSSHSTNPDRLLMGVDVSDKSVVRLASKQNNSQR